MDTFKRKSKEISIVVWAFIKEKLQRFWVMLRRVWKKYHVTKVGLLLILSISLILSVFLTIQARRVDVDTLQVGLQETTKVIDDQGEEAGRLYSQKGTYTPTEAISPTIQHALVSTEDQRFLEHRGFDLIGIGRAAVGYLMNGYIVGGGSTITQQLAKNAYLTADQTLLRKLKELFLAIEIEKSYSKNTILEMYLNNSYFGQGVWGVQDASKKYFNKNASELNVSEGATLVGLLKAPSNYNPIDNYEAAINRRNVVLMLMEETGAITPEERQVASQSELALADGYNSADDYRYPYYFDAVISEAMNRYDFEEQEILNGGYTIYTNLNQNQQQQMDTVYNQDGLFETAADGVESQSASVAMNPQNGGVTALVGGRGEHTFRGFNRATQMTRQPGSIIKPLGVYAPALEAGYEIDSILIDEQQAFGETEDGKGYTPSNVDHTYDGEIPMFQALAESKNAATVWLLNEIGIRRGYNKIEDFGIELTEKDYVLGAVALGGLDQGASPLEMASAYSVFANNGIQVEPHFITKIVDATGAIVVDNSDPREKRVLSEAVNDDMNRMLLNVFSNGNAQNIQPAGYQIAGKTGTTQTSGESGATDQWTVGYTPDLVIASWAGYDKTDVEQGHYMKSYTTAGIGQVLKAEFETMLPYTQGTQFAVDDSEIEVIVQENQETEAARMIREGLERTGEAIKGTTKKAVDSAKDLFNSFLNR